MEDKDGGWDGNDGKQVIELAGDLELSSASELD